MCSRATVLVGALNIFTASSASIQSSNREQLRSDKVNWLPGQALILLTVVLHPLLQRPVASVGRWVLVADVVLFYCSHLLAEEQEEEDASLAVVVVVMEGKVKRLLCCFNFGLLPWIQRRRRRRRLLRSWVNPCIFHNNCTWVSTQLSNPNKSPICADNYNAPL